MVVASSQQVSSGESRGVPALQVVADLRRQMEHLQGRPEVAAVPVHPALHGLLQMRAGGVYGVDAASLASLLVAGPSMQGSWCGIVGAPDLGVEAAVAAGVDPARTVVVPDPGDRWLEVTAALVDVLALVVVRPGQPVTERDAARLAARVRSRGSVLVPWGPWPRLDASLRLSEVRWSGLGQGHGHLSARRATVAVHRGAAPPRRRELWMPSVDQEFCEVGQDVTQAEPALAPGAERLVRTVRSA